MPPAAAALSLKTWAPWTLLGATILIVWTPTFIDLYRTVWRVDPHSQGPMAMVLAVWLFWHKLRQPRARAALARAVPQPAWGWAWLLPGWLMLVIGRSQGLLAFEMAALAVCATGLTVLLWGGGLARALGFCYLFLLFSVPLPGVLVDALTQPMKIAVSWTAEHWLHAAGLAVARDGVILHVGPYQLLVADACAGLHSLFTLEAFGLLYLNVVHHPSALRNGLMAVFIVPVAFAANTLRVMLLAWVTLTWGDAAGQGLVHDFSGLLLFAVALLLIVAADALARQIARLWTGVDASRSAPRALRCRHAPLP